MKKENEVALQQVQSQKGRIGRTELVLWINKQIASRCLDKTLAKQPIEQLAYTVLITMATVTNDLLI